MLPSLSTLPILSTLSTCYQHHQLMSDSLAVSSPPPLLPVCNIQYFQPRIKYFLYLPQKGCNWNNFFLLVNFLFFSCYHQLLTGTKTSNIHDSYKYFVIFQILKCCVIKSHWLYIKQIPVFLWFSTNHLFDISRNFFSGQRHPYRGPHGPRAGGHHSARDFHFSQNHMILLHLFRSRVWRIKVCILAHAS